MRFVMIISHRALYTFEKNGQSFETQFIEGSEEFPISANNVSEDTGIYMDTLADEKNLGTTAMLEFDVIECSDTGYNNSVRSVLGDRVNNVYSFKDMIETVLKKLMRDKKLLVDKYGINYDGYSYRLNNNAIVRGEFDLLAYTVHGSDVVGSMDIK